VGGRVIIATEFQQGGPMRTLDEQAEMIREVDTYPDDRRYHVSAMVDALR